MNRPTVYATYTQKGENIYRNSTYIQWGKSNESIGACLLLNPGSAKFGEGTHKLLRENMHVHDRIEHIDPTMRQLIRFIEEIYSDREHITGRFHIYNLFTLQNPVDKHAIDSFESLVNEGEVDIEDSLISEQEMRTHPWILVGWGVARKKKWTNFQLVKNKWKAMIDEAGIPVIGIKHDKYDDFYHPSPNNPNKQSTLERLINIYRNKFYVQRFTKDATKPNLLSQVTPVEVVDQDTERWYRSPNNPESIVKRFSQLCMKQGYKLRAYQFDDDGNGNAVVYAIPSTKNLPHFSEYNSEEHIFLSPPKPDFALNDFMEAIDGDRKPLSYLQAAIVTHELQEFGARCNGTSWRRDMILPASHYKNKKLEWELIEPIPKIIEPHFYYNKEGNPVIVFHSINDIGMITWKRYVHTFSKDDYTSTVERTVIGTAGMGNHS